MSKHGDLELFFNVLKLFGADRQIGRCIELVKEAIISDPVMFKITELTNRLSDYEQSHSAADAKKLLQSVEGSGFGDKFGVAKALKLVLALLGWREHYFVVAEIISGYALGGEDLLQHERDELLLLGLGWQAIALGLPLACERRFGYRRDKFAPVAGYELAVRIRSIPNLSPNLSGILQKSDEPAERYKTLPDGAAAGMPVSILGYVPSEFYAAGLDNPEFSAGEFARRIAVRFPLSKDTCEAVVNEPHEASLTRSLIEELKVLERAGFDTRGEVEALVYVLAQAGDRDALLESAQFAFRRGYHGRDEHLLLYALAALGLASGAVKPNHSESYDNPVQVRIRETGRTCSQILTERRRKGEREKSFIDAELEAAEERHRDELAEKIDEAEISSDPESDQQSLTPEEVRTYFGDQGATRSRAVAERRNKQKLALRQAERLKVVLEIGNPDMKSDARTALAALEKLKVPLEMAPFPAELAVWRDQLLAEFLHCANAIGAIYEDLLARQIQGLKGFLARPILLVGAPGTGKSRLARRIAETASLPFKLYAAGGIADSHFGGLSRGWHGGHPSVPLELIRQSQCPNPLLLVDEVEKAAVSRHNGNLVDTLLGMLEPETSAKWSDPYTQGPINLSVVNWFFTANDVEALPGPFRDRCRVVRVEAPLPEHLPQLARSVLKDLAPVAGHEDWVQPLSQEELEALSDAWSTGSRSIRGLKRLVEGVLKARDMASTKH